MKAIVLHDVSEPEALRPEEVADPTPGPGEAVVRLRAAALNRRDLYICRGQYTDLHFPIIPGSDGVGEVADVGPGVAGVAAGDQVVINPSLEWGDNPRVPGPKWRILGLPDDGTFAQMVKVPADSLFPRPAGLSDEDAAALPLAGLTAYRAVVTRGGVRDGDTVLVTGIGGGLDTFDPLIDRHRGAWEFVNLGR